MIKDYYSVFDVPYLKENLNEKNIDEFVEKYIKNKSKTYLVEKLNKFKTLFFFLFHIK